MHDDILPKSRMLMLRAAYAIIGLGLAVSLWPQLVEPVQDWPLKSGVVAAMLAALSLLALFGLWRPIIMLPVLVFEVLWKTIWLGRMALPLWLTGAVDDQTAMTIFECALVVPVALLVPWDLVWRRFVGTAQANAAAVTS